MAGVVVCHGSLTVRERIVMAALGVPALSPVRAAGSADELIALARRVPPAIVLLDAHLAAPGPVEAMRRLGAVCAPATVVLLAVPGDEVALDRAIALGARGYVSPDLGRAELAAVAAHILAGTGHGEDGSTGTARREADLVAAGNAMPSAALPVQSTGGMDTVPLTAREIEVLTGMSNGRSNAQIGQELYLSEDTIKTHARRLFRKLGAADRAQAVAIGLRRGLIR